MDISAIIKAIVAPLENRGEGDPSGFNPGDRLLGRILRVETDGRLFIDLGKFKAYAHSSVSVASGDLLRLQVVQTGSPLHLKVLSAESGDGKPLPLLAPDAVVSASEQKRFVALVDHLVHRGSASAPLLPDAVQTALLKVRDLFHPLPIDQSARDIAVWLRQALEDNGLFLESKLADRIAAAGDGQPSSCRQPTQPLPSLLAADGKAQLLMLKTFLMQEPFAAATGGPDMAKDIAFMRACVDRLLGHVEQQQERLVQRSGDAEAFQVVSHWLTVEEQRQPIQLKAYYPKRQRGSSQPGMHRIALLLDMDRLGPLRVDLAMLGRQLHIDFFVQTEAVKDRIQRHVHEVEDLMRGFFEDLLITVRVAEDKIAQFNREEIGQGPAGRIDIKA